jgi:hypothetical protein
MKSKFFKLNASDLLKGLLVAFITALLTGRYQVVQAGSDLTWVSFKPVLIASIGAGLSYLIKNLCTNSDGQFAVSENGNSSSSGAKILILAVLLSAVGFRASAQHPGVPRELSKKVSPWTGFFRPVTTDIFISNSLQAALTPSAWVFRPTVEITAMQLIPTKESGKIFDVSSFQSVGMGMSYQHFIEVEGAPYNDYGFNALLLFDAIPRETTAINLSLAATVSALKILNFGAGYNFGIKKIFLLTGLTYNFN